MENNLYNYVTWGDHNLLSLNLEYDGSRQVSYLTIQLFFWLFPNHTVSLHLIFNQFLPPEVTLFLEPCEIHFSHFEIFMTLNIVPTSNSS